MPSSDVFDAFPRLNRFEPLGSPSPPLSPRLGRAEGRHAQSLVPHSSSSSSRPPQAEQPELQPDKEEEQDEGQEQQRRGWLRLVLRARGLLVAACLSLLTALLFLLRSSGLASKSCSSVILFWSEVLKVGFSFAIVTRNGHLHLAQRSLLLGCVPSACYGLGSILSFWAVRHLDADTAALLSQLKLPATAMLSYLCLGRRISSARVFALAAIIFGAIAEEMYGLQDLAWSTSEGATLPSAAARLPSNHAMHLYLLAVLALTLEALVSSAGNVFLQWAFADMATLWVRNLQFALLSMSFYGVTHLAEGTHCEPTLDSTGLLVTVLQALMGLCAALTLLWLGAIEKTLATVSSLVLTGLLQSAAQRRFPDQVHCSIALIIINGIVQFMTSS